MIALRLLILCVVGAAMGAVANHAIHRWCLFGQRLFGPWGKQHESSSAVNFGDRLPIIGWWFLRRDSHVHGPGYWIRPLLIEIAMAIAVPALYYFETQTGLLLPNIHRVAMTATFEPWATQIFISHVILLGLMVAATFIDFDERTIPDSITVPGTLIALLLSCFSLSWFLPYTQNFVAIAPPVQFLPTTFYLPFDPRTPVAVMDPKWAGGVGLWTAFAIWSGWCFALADRRVIMRKGLAKAVEFFLAGLTREPTWKILATIWGVGLVGIGIVWNVGGHSWQGLLTSLIGLAVGGGVVWAIRIVASLAMRQEAMGFGDVTLMAMIGAFIGWQGAVMGFFTAPLAAIVIVLIYFIVTRDSSVPFGPYLCAGTLMTIVFWDALVVQWFMPNVMLLGGFLFWIGVAILGLMGVVLSIWRIIKFQLIGFETDPNDEPSRG